MLNVLLYHQNKADNLMFYLILHLVKTHAVDIQSTTQIYYQEERKTAASPG